MLWMRMIVLRIRVEANLLMICFLVGTWLMFICFFLAAAEDRMIFII